MNKKHLDQASELRENRIQIRIHRRERSTCKDVHASYDPRVV